MLADGAPAWLLAWRAQEGQREPAPLPPPVPPRPAPKPVLQLGKPVDGANWQGFVDPGTWPYDGGARREPGDVLVEQLEAGA